MSRFVIQGRKKGKKKWFDCHQDPICIGHPATPGVVKFPDGGQGFDCHVAAMREKGSVRQQHGNSYEYRVVQLLIE